MERFLERTGEGGIAAVERGLHGAVSPVSSGIIIVLIFRIGGLLNAGFEQILLLYSPSVYQVSDIIDTYVYRADLIGRQYSFGAAMGLFKSVLALILMYMANKVSQWLGREGLW